MHKRLFANLGVAILCGAAMSAAPASASFTIQTVEITGDVNLYSSLSLSGAGQLRAAYLRREGACPPWNNFSTLRYGELEQNWQIEGFLDGACPIAADRVFSLCRDTLGEPSLLFKRTRFVDSQFQYALIYATRAGGEWTLEEVPSVGANPDEPRMLLDSGGSPRFACQDDAADAVLYGAWSGGAWTVEEVDAEYGGYLEFALDSQDVPHVVYYRALTLYHAWKSEGNWQREVVDPNGDLFGCTAIAFDSQDRLQIAYSRPSGVMMYGQREAGGWVVAPIAEVNGAPSADLHLALDASDSPHISYVDRGNRRPYLLRRPSGQGWLLAVVQDVPTSENDTSIAVGSDGAVYVGFAAGSPQEFRIGTEAAITAVGTPGPGRSGDLRLFPNPTVGDLELRWDGRVSGNESARFEVWDVLGRRVTSFDGLSPRGTRVSHWDGTDDAGDPVAAGVYTISLTRAGRESASARAVIVR